MQTDPACAVEPAPGTSPRQQVPCSTRMQKMRYRHPTEDCGFIELDHRMLRKDFVKQLRNGSGAQMVSVFMLFQKRKTWLFLEDWRILPDSEDSAAPGLATADLPCHMSRSLRNAARKRMLRGLLLEARRKYAMRKRTRSLSSSSSEGSTASGIAAEASGLQTSSERSDGV